MYYKSPMPIFLHWASRRGYISSHPCVICCYNIESYIRQCKSNKLWYLYYIKRASERKHSCTVRSILRWPPARKFAHTIYLLDSLQVPYVKSAIVNKCATLYNSIFNSDTPTTDFNAHLMARYISSGELIKGTLIHSIVCFGLLSVSIAFVHPHIMKYKYSTQYTLQHLLYHQNFIKPYSDEHYLVHLLTNSF